MAYAGQYSGQQFCITLKASAAITIYEAVTIASESDGECKAVASAGAIVFGVAQHAASTGDAVAVCIMGITKVVAGAAVTKGVAIQADANSRMIAATTADEVCGLALEAAAAAGDYITAVVSYGGIF